MKLFLLDSIIYMIFVLQQHFCEAHEITIFQ
jgi:hypothetical protein